MRLSVKLQIPQHRQRYKDTAHSSRVADVIAKNYAELRQEFVKKEYGNYSSMSYEDIFQETVLFVIQDKKAFDLSDDEIIQHFKFRYNMIRFRIIQESKKTTIYANDSQEKE